MVASLLLLTLLTLWCGCIEASSPVLLRSYTGTTNCPLVHDDDDVKANVAQALYVPPCGCGSVRNIFGWRRVAHLDMTDPTQICPPTWNLRTGSSVRGCARVETKGGICESVFFPTNGLQYSRVCGKIIGYQVGNPDAFYDSIIQGRTSIDQGYVDGISLTHGSNPRKHIWTLAAAITKGIHRRQRACRCTNIRGTWPHTIPGFIGNNTFCDSGNNGGPRGNIFESDPLWDGAGCGRNNACCQENGPPWFCAILPAVTSEDFEVRLCLGDVKGDEDLIIESIEIYVQ